MLTCPRRWSRSLSAVQSKAGLYGFIVIGLGLLAAAMHAGGAGHDRARCDLRWSTARSWRSSEHDVKRIVAYSSLSHLGLDRCICDLQRSNPSRSAERWCTSSRTACSAPRCSSFWARSSSVKKRGCSRDSADSARAIRAWPARFTIAALAALGLPGLARFRRRDRHSHRRLSSRLCVGRDRARSFRSSSPSAYMLRLFQDAMQRPPSRGPSGSVPISRWSKGWRSRRSSSHRARGSRIPRPARQPQLALGMRTAAEHRCAARWSA